MFDNELSMLVFDIQVIADVKRVETFLMEAELAKCYYGNVSLLYFYLFFLLLECARQDQ